MSAQADIKRVFAADMPRCILPMKGRSSRVLRDEFPTLRSRLPTLWTHSYFVATVGGAPLAIVKQYIEEQRHV